VNPDAIAESAPRDGDIVILEHADGSKEFFGRSGRVTHHDWDKMLRAAKMAARPHAVWVQRDGENPRRVWTYEPGEIV
jgi:hypothetical protein